MFDKFDFKSSITGQIVHFNTDPDPVNGYLPLNNVHFDQDIRSVSRPKMEAHGEWPTHTYFGHMLIHCEGDILAPNSTKYNQLKLNMLNTIYPIPQVLDTDRILGQLIIKWTGQSEDFVCDVNLDGAFEIPLQGLSPSRSPFQVTFKSFTPYMEGLFSGRKYWVA